MTTEELLKSRYKVIADYPDNKNKVGDIITIQTAQTKEAEKLVCGWYDKYPAIFESLPWWKDRKIEDMPGYLKVNYKNGVEFHKVSQWLHKIGEETVYEYFNKGGLQLRETTRGTEPADQSEYEAYLQTTNQLNNGQ